MIECALIDRHARPLPSPVWGNGNAGQESDTLALGQVAFRSGLSSWPSEPHSLDWVTIGISASPPSLGT